MRKLFITFLLLTGFYLAKAQDSLQLYPVPDTPFIPTPKIDTPLRIINLNPFFSVHVDSVVNYQFRVNKNPENFFWYLKNAPVGVKINKDNGTFYFKADKAYFLSGKLKYDYNYKVFIGVQNLDDPSEKIDTSFTVVFFNTEILPSQLKPTVNGTIYIDEGDTLRFKVMCENGSFPIESILTSTSAPIGDFTPVHRCDDEFRWSPTYEFVKETDTGKMKSVVIKFVGSTRFRMQDTASIKIVVRNALNYPIALEQYGQLVHEMNSYVLKLKYTFFAVG